MPAPAIRSDGPSIVSLPPFPDVPPPPTSGEAPILPDAPAVIVAPVASAPVSAKKGVIAARIEQSLGATKEALIARREAYAEIISGHEQTIKTLETELAQINQRISQKSGEAQSLLARKQRLLSEIKDNQRMATAAAAYGGLLGLFTFGASAVVGAGIAATAGMTALKLQGDYNSASAAESSLRSEVQRLDEQQKAHYKIQSELQSRLGVLKQEHAALIAAAPAAVAPGQSVAALQAGVEHDEKVIANLEQQIATLQAAKATAGAFEHTIDQVIAQLKKDVVQLEERLVESRRVLFSTLIDVAVAGFAANGALRKAGVDAFKKKALLAGFDLASGNVYKAITPLLDKLVEEGLLLAKVTEKAGKVLKALLSPNPQVADLLGLPNLTKAQESAIKTLFGAPAPQ